MHYFTFIISGTDRMSILSKFKSLESSRASYAFPNFNHFFYFCLVLLKCSSIAPQSLILNEAEAGTKYTHWIFSSNRTHEAY